MGIVTTLQTVSSQLEIQLMSPKVTTTKSIIEEIASKVYTFLDDMKLIVPVIMAAIVLICGFILMLMGDKATEKVKGIFIKIIIGCILVAFAVPISSAVCGIFM
ncbi:MAG: hypothetical protein UH241_04630 [Acutalibacteraceae bacterium]|nr:hypothetical protein [Acutalibacteraceae bacterium]